jgi:hypothetical protein
LVLLLSNDLVVLVKRWALAHRSTCCQQSVRNLAANLMQALHCLNLQTDMQKDWTAAVVGDHSASQQLESLPTRPQATSKGS